ncbi:MAG: flagellar export chaperone FliS [Chloroflexota bacterium]|jgi:flagellin-specific chaperone FliS
MYSAHQAAKYRENDIMNASPIHLVVMVYDVAIAACEEKDLSRATRAVSVLRDALNFDYQEAAGLFRLYQWVMDCVRESDYDNAISVLRELRDSWSTVEARLSGTPPPTNTPPAQQSNSTVGQTKGISA